MSGERSGQQERILYHSPSLFLAVVPDTGSGCSSFKWMQWSLKGYWGLDSLYGKTITTQYSPKKGWLNYVAEIQALLYVPALTVHTPSDTRWLAREQVCLYCTTNIASVCHLWDNLPGEWQRWGPWHALRSSCAHIQTIILFVCFAMWLHTVTLQGSLPSKWWF